MSRLKIKLRIWLSIGIFVFGYLASTIVALVDRRINESHLGSIHDVLVPAARSGQDAGAAFDVLEWRLDSRAATRRTDPEGADAAGNRVLEGLNAIARLPGIAAARAAAAVRLGSSIRRFLDEANYTPGNAPAVQEQDRRLWLEAQALRGAITELSRDLSQDLDSAVYRLRAHSARMRVFTVSLFIATLTAAAYVVNITIQRSIMNPLQRVHAQLAHERDLLNILLDNIPDDIYFKDAGSKFIRINKAMASRFGLDSPEAAVGRSDADYFDPETAARLLEEDRLVLKWRETNQSEFEPFTRLGVTRWMATTKVPVHGGSGAAPAIVGISRDITEWKGTMEELKRSEASFRLLFSVIPYPAFVCDAENLKILEANNAATLSYGYSPAEFRKVGMGGLVPPGDRERLKLSLEAHGPANLPAGTWKHLTQDGRSLDVEVDAHMLRFRGQPMLLCIAQDVSERKRLEVELRHAQKLEAVGQLAAGIAHEINTPIQYVGDNLRFLSDVFQERQAVFFQYERLFEAVLAGEVPPGLMDQVKAARDGADMEYLASEVPRAMEQSMDGVQRIATIVRAMKAFAHPGSPEKKPADLNKALSDALIVARNELKYVAEVVTDFGELPAVQCSLGDLNQVFLNLLVNAAHAIGDVVKETGVLGEIRIATRREQGEAIISISDTGGGIPASIRSRIFDPFFTTKEVGKGTGQGLAIARSIVVEKHGGKISFEPNFPRGTTFLISLPIDGAPADADRGASAESVPAKSGLAISGPAIL